MRQDAHAQADRNQAQHGGGITAHLLHDVGPKPGVRAQAEELVVEFRPGLTGAEDKVFTPQIAELQRLAPCEWMPLGQDDLERQAPDNLALEAIERDGKMHQGYVYPAIPQGSQFLRGQAVDVVQLHLGMLFPEGPDDRQKVVEMEAAGIAYHQAAGYSPGARARFVGRLGRLGENRTRPLVKDPAGPCELDPGAAPIEERRLQIVLEVLHLAAEGGLRDPQARRGMGKVQLLSHRNEVTEVSQFHASTIPGAHGWTKKQSIGRKRRPDVKWRVMNETKATTTGTTAADQVTSPKPEVRTESEGLTVEIRPQRPSEPAREAGDTQHAPRNRPRSGHRFVLALLGAAVIAAAAWFGYRWWEYTRIWVKTDNAYVAAHIHQISSRVAGTVSEVLVEENQLVTAGQLLARLDARDYEVKRQQALAQLAQARAQVQQAQSRIAQAQSEVTREQVHVTKTQQDLERAKVLSRDGNAAISRQDFDTAQAAADGALAALQSVKSAQQSAEAAAGAAEAQGKVAEANVKEAELLLSYTEIVAPAAGRIGKKNLETGNRVLPGQALLALVQPDVWVAANFKETQLDRVHPGQEVRVRVDAFPGRVLAGRVESLSPASGAQFALLPPDNATGNFTKIVQRVPVRIVFDGQTATDCAGRLVPGMSAIVEIKVGG